jgi:23S rRNA (adenine2503-C2)-methyltransferase
MTTPRHPAEQLPDEWRAELSAQGERSFRAKQIFEWIHGRGVMDPARMTNLSKGLRARLAERGLAPPLELVHTHRSVDGSRKLLVRMHDGTQVETVLLPVAQRGLADDADAAAADDSDVDDGDAEVPQRARVTQCISTQVGCAMGCVFCASGVAGLTRHMSAAEIAAQVLMGRDALEDGERLNHVVFMGMGEPLDNYEATARAIRLMTHPDGLGLSPRRITVSTSGLVAAIDRLGEDFEGRVGLAISLHQADDDKRSQLMPVNRKNPLRELMTALRRYPLPRGRRITVEYTLVAGQNDSLDDAARLVRLLGRLPVKVNLIPMNPIAASSLGPPAAEQVAAFQQRVADHGILCFVRRRRGDDVAAACGQLAILGAKPTKSFEKRQPKEPASK